MPETRYVRVGEEFVAYQVVGDAASLTLWCLGFAQGIDVIWEHPSAVGVLGAIASWSRLLLVQTRGTGASTPAVDRDIFETSARDVEAVMAAVGAEQLVVVGAGDSGLFGTHFAATRPERVRGLVLINSYARLRRDRDYPVGVPDAVMSQMASSGVDNWGRAENLRVTAPSAADDPEFRAWWAKSERATSSPDVQRRRYEAISNADLRSLLPSITARTVIIHRTGNRYVRLGHARYLADHIANAKLVELPGEDHVAFVGDVEPILGEIEELTTGARGAAPLRGFAVILFSDIVDSTASATEMGDEAWRTVLDAHDGVVRRGVTSYGGTVLKFAGDGFVATFDAPSRAVRCAVSIRDSLTALGLSTRMGLHAAEIERRGADISGVGVHVAARLSSLAQPGEILTTQTIKDLTTGSGLSFDDRGSHTLKGLADRWHLLALDIH